MNIRDAIIANKTHPICKAGSKFPIEPGLLNEDWDWDFSDIMAEWEIAQPRDTLSVDEALYIIERHAYGNDEQKKDLIHYMRYGSDYVGGNI